MASTTFGVAISPRPIAPTRTASRAIGRIQSSPSRTTISVNHFYGSRQRVCSTELRRIGVSRRNDHQSGCRYFRQALSLAKPRFFPCLPTLRFRWRPRTGIKTCYPPHRKQPNDESAHPSPLVTGTIALKCSFLTFAADNAMIGVSRHVFGDTRQPDQRTSTREVVPSPTNAQRNTLVVFKRHDLLPTGSPEPSGLHRTSQEGVR